MNIESSFIHSSQKVKKKKQMSIDEECVNKMCPCIHTAEYYLAIKRNEA